MNIDLMSVFICHHTYYIDATYHIVLHPWEARRIIFHRLFDEILVFYCSVYGITDSFLLFSSTIYLYFSHTAKLSGTRECSSFRQNGNK